MNIELLVEGMRCEGCENRLKNIITTIPNVGVNSISHKTGIVNITIDNQETLNKVIEKIESIGFNIKKDN